MAIKLKHIILYLGLWIFTTSSAYYFGTMKPNQKKIKPWKPAMEFKVIKLPREEPPDTSQLLNEYIGEVQTKEEKSNGERKV